MGSKRGLVLVVLALSLIVLSRGGHGVLGRTVGAESSSSSATASASAGGNTRSAKEADRVLNLPGQPNVSFAHYAGYVTVNESHGRALFYWFFEAASDHSSKPLLLWLNGGPGCSSVGYGEAEELGPFRVNKDGRSLSYNSYAWNYGANLLFVESPAGVGFSYSNTTSDYRNFGDTQTALDAYAFLVNWLERFPEYKSRNFFIAGESYAGHYIPELSKVILDNNKASNFTINLKGILMGNALIDDGLDTKGRVDYAWSHAILPDAFYSNISANCGNYSQNSSQECFYLADQVFDYYAPIDIYSIYSDLCQKNNSKSRTLSSKVISTNKLKFYMRIQSLGGYDPCMDLYVSAYLNNPKVQQALHATQAGPSFMWTACSDELFMYWMDSPWSMLPTLKELIGEGLRVWMYNGDWDGLIPFLSTRYSIGALQLPMKIDWHPWYYKQQVAGWTEEYEGIVFATIRRAGHMVPAFQPGQSLALLSSFLVGSPLGTSAHN